MNEIVFEILKILVMVAVLIATRYLIPWAKAKIGTENLEVAAQWARYAVLMAQQVLWQDTGNDKKAFVTKFLKELLMAKNIAISDEQIDILIEAAVKQMKMEENAGIVIEATNEIKEEQAMTEAQARQKTVGIMQGWLGLKESDGSHKVVIDTYNRHTPRARGYKVTYKDAWCATAWSAAGIKAGFTDIFPLECSCYYLIEKAKEMGIWVENDAYVPEPGDGILYDWGDSGVGDCIGAPEHIGMVEKVVGNTITVIEGNISDSVGRRNIAVNAKYIRGYICPKYELKADTKEEAPVTPVVPVVPATTEYKVGDIVEFTGTKHYTSSYPTGKAKNCKPGIAKVTQISKGKPHPYLLKAVSGGGSNVHGWTDAADIQGLADSASTEIKVGDIVTYTGTVHYTSSYASGKARNCKGGKAKVTRISKGKPHPYHLESAEKGCTVHGWTDADKVKK